MGPRRSLRGPDHTGAPLSWLLDYGSSPLVGRRQRHAACVPAGLWRGQDFFLVRRAARACALITTSAGTFFVSPVSYRVYERWGTPTAAANASCVIPVAARAVRRSSFGSGVPFIGANGTPE
jgi:hypothetical protein